MDTAKYRKKYEQQLLQAATKTRSQRNRQAMALNVAGSLATEYEPPAEQDDVITLIANQQVDPARRATALATLASRIDLSEDAIAMVIGLLRDTNEAPMIRLAALRCLQVVSFTSLIFNAMRPEFLAALRTAVDSDDEELRHEALTSLAQAKDEYAQRRLLEGLQNPSAALMPPEMAIRLLGYDVHASYFPLLQNIVRKPPNAVAKREAIRLLAADPGSRDLLMELLNDKRQSRPTRQASAVALQSLAPTDFEHYARQIVLDPTENPELRSTLITGLNNFRSQEVISQDTEINNHIRRLNEEAPSPALKRSTALYLTKLNEG